ncbi:hypothetical protein M427DRAFT_32649 [Gonapodya prolifera JEL478]|uniref:Uncharacterized protein n=1 Tax=Gonapodya prolifera (strain JEL478) TaxID=1344416 RepID=A0A139ADP1_GONPJ|nr:hypothetical protein M427DRAFT_32649 [Gonapodya prolifera JEL478]|eukprot:KXS14911.1 hypothetical protein M427DRAFT_32649 [Gonapodya prolifera JEL478]
MPVDSKAPKRVHNIVHDDAIWRAACTYEQQTARDWETKWGFMKDEKWRDLSLPTSSSATKPSRHATSKSPASPVVTSNPFSSGLPSTYPPGLVPPEYQLPTDLSSVSSPHSPSSQKSPASLSNPESLTSDPNALLSTFLLAHKTQLVTKFKPPAEKYTAPATTSMDIGWRVVGLAKERGDPKEAARGLERFGRLLQGRGRRDVKLD